LPPTSHLFIFLASLTLTRTASFIEMSNIQSPKMKTKERDDPGQTPISHLRCKLQVFHLPSSPLFPQSQLFMFLASLNLTRRATCVQMSNIQNSKKTKERNDPRQTPISHLRCHLQVFHPPRSPLPPTSQLFVFSQASPSPAQPLWSKCLQFKIQK
jgi:hypothetical protein